jgi:hypothetical protein
MREIQQDYYVMNKPLRILHLEDDPDYSDLVRSLLAGAGFQVEVGGGGEPRGF